MDASTATAVGALGIVAWVAYNIMMPREQQVTTPPLPLVGRMDPASMPRDNLIPTSKVLGTTNLSPGTSAVYEPSSPLWLPTIVPQQLTNIPRL